MNNATSVTRSTPPGNALIQPPGLPSSNGPNQPTPAMQPNARNRPLPGQRYFPACDSRCVEITAGWMLAAALAGGGAAAVGIACAGYATKGPMALSTCCEQTTCCFGGWENLVAFCGGAASIGLGSWVGVSTYRYSRAPAPTQAPVPTQAPAEQRMDRSGSAGIIQLPNFRT